MTKLEKLNCLKVRLIKLEGRPQNVKSQGVVKKLRREIKGLMLECL